MIRIPTHGPPTHPGEMLLEEFLKPMGLSQVELAGKILPEGPAVSAIPEKPAKPLPARPDEHSELSMESEVVHKMGTVVDFAQKKGSRFPVTP